MSHLLLSLRHVTSRQHREVMLPPPSTSLTFSPISAMSPAGRMVKTSSPPSLSLPPSPRSPACHQSAGWKWLGQALPLPSHLLPDLCHLPFSPISVMSPAGRMEISLTPALPLTCSPISIMSPVCRMERYLSALPSLSLSPSPQSPSCYQSAGWKWRDVSLPSSLSPSPRFPSCHQPAEWTGHARADRL